MKIQLGNAINNYQPLLNRIGQSSHNNNSNFTGYAQGQYRLSSPIYVSIIKNTNNYYPIITTLNTVFPNNNNNQNNTTNAFINQILNGGN